MDINALNANLNRDKWGVRNFRALKSLLVKEVQESLSEFMPLTSSSYYTPTQKAEKIRSYAYNDVADGEALLPFRNLMVYLRDHAGDGMFIGQWVDECIAFLSFVQMTDQQLQNPDYHRLFELFFNKFDKQARFDYTELRRLSLDFRRLSSNFLNSTDDTAATMIQRFKKYIDDTPFISGIISDAIGEVDYDWQNCFRQSKHSGWHEIEVPVDEACHVKAMYDYLDYIISNGSNILGIAMHYPHSQKKFNEIIQHFLDIAFKPLIDFINDAISKEMILMEEQKPLGVTQNIGTVYGTVNQQGGGTINSETTVLAGNLDQIAEIEKMIEKILPHLDDIPDIPKDAADDVKDDLESVKEQINAPAPKKKRLQKAIGGIKKFFGDFSPQLAAALAAHAITTTDWNAMIASVEKLISSL